MITRKEIKMWDQNERMFVFGVLWDEFMKNKDDDILNWHLKVLEERLKAAEEGKVKYRPWVKVRQELLND